MRNGEALEFRWKKKKKEKKKRREERIAMGIQGAHIRREYSSGKYM